MFIPPQRVFGGSGSALVCRGVTPRGDTAVTAACAGAFALIYWHLPWVL